MAPQRFQEQFDQIQRSMPGVELAMGPDDAAEFIYEKGVVLARDGEEARIVEDTVRAHFTTFAGLTADEVRRESPETNRSGITRIRVGDPGEGGPRGDRAVAGALRALRQTEGNAGRRLVSRNHVVHIAPVNACPGDEPVPVPFAAGPNPAVARAATTRTTPSASWSSTPVSCTTTRPTRRWPTSRATPRSTSATAMACSSSTRDTARSSRGSSRPLPPTRTSSPATRSTTPARSWSPSSATSSSRLSKRDGWPAIISLSAGSHIARQLDAAGSALWRGAIPADIRADTLWTLDAIVDDAGTVWLLETNCNPMVHPDAYFAMLEGIFRPAAE